ncbi:hypothetical protein KW783_03645 [Candidatus Parcubacteria bacterium]|nr:hypothetical protein [Candidatus Parcubacteria bacterium]
MASLALFGNDRRRLPTAPRRRKEVVTDMFVEHTMPSKNERESKEPLA